MDWGRHVTAQVYWRRLFAEGNATIQQQLRAAVAAGQLEYAGGGWVQTDEAITWFVAFLTSNAFTLQSGTVLSHTLH